MALFTMYKFKLYDFSTWNTYKLKPLSRKGVTNKEKLKSENTSIQIKNTINARLHVVETFSGPGMPKSVDIA